SLIFHLSLFITPFLYITNRVFLAPDASQLVWDHVISNMIFFACFKMCILVVIRFFDSQFADQYYLGLCFAAFTCYLCWSERSGKELLSILPHVTHSSRWS
ncbi:hypothetical protein PFISCL1PPCAC_19183, partial [Pristionchus fissidentatus]